MLPDSATGLSPITNKGSENPTDIMFSLLYHKIVSLFYRVERSTDKSFESKPAGYALPLLIDQNRENNRLGQ
ncbi:hypothetical protein KTT_38380 [Tengunoibacter tsumagoiensis]|uniref:Uncharacterized protein n=1 Tax=Tengunoibacter tsumagoiensis TaxID=2014871 RepID=A0A402A4I4_9CHLR|nr:hypothetical protein KTT_38380 [Tengunoibacter tsumagoiensis]